MLQEALPGYSLVGNKFRNILALIPVDTGQLDAFFVRCRRIQIS